MATTTDPTELRLALVFNGGVSLAVWMAGVTHEIDRLRRKDGPWREVCADANADVVVDIIAGTSAGGINGALLACAVAAGEPLPGELRDLWIRDAALTAGKLLNDGTEEVPHSLLDGDYFTSTIRKVIAPRAERVAERGGQPIEPVTLFVTATATAGPQPRGSDALGQQFGYEDHRRLYRFVADAQRQVHDPQRGPHPRVRNDFCAGEALVTAARASAGFPGAFAPVSEEPLLAIDDLRVQPNLPHLRLPTFLIDGGVLDNAPFAPVVEEMAHRPVSGRYRRILGYVVPSSGLRGSAAAVPASDVAGLCPPLHSVFSGSLNLPREVDFRSDVDELDDRLAVAEEAPADRLFDRLLGGAGDELRASAAGLIGEYRRARTVDGVWKARRLLRRRPLATDLGRPAPVDLTHLVDDANLWVPPAHTRLDDALKGPLWTWGISAAQQVVAMMLREVRRHLNDDGTAPAFTDPRRLALGLSAALSKILAIDDAVQRATVDRATADGVSPEASDETIAAMVNAVFDEQRVREYLLVVVRAAAASYAESVGDEPADVVERALAAEVLSRAFAVPSMREHTPPFDFVRIGPDVDSPLVALGEYQEAGDRKLFGTRVGHFGAFAADGARAHDWLWGRLDGAAHLTRLVLQGQPDIVVRRRIAEVQLAILDDEAARAGAADGAALLSRLAGAHRRVTGDGRELVRSFLRTPDGRATAVGVATAATRLLSHGCFHAVNPSAPEVRERAGWQRTLEAIMAPSRPDGLTLGNRIARTLTGPLRTGLWCGLRDDPNRVAKRLRTRLILLLLGTAGVVFALGGLIGAAAALYHSGDEVFRWTAFGLILAVIIGFLTAAWRTMAAADRNPETAEQPQPAAAAP